MTIDPRVTEKTTASENKRMLKTAVGLIGAGIIFLVVLQLMRVDIFTLRLPRESSKLAAAVRVQTGQAVRLSYRHSVELMQVEGRFEVGPGPSLLLRETRMMSAGTGLPNTYPNRTRREGPWFVVDEEMREVGGFRFFMVPINQTRLAVAGEPINLDNIKTGSIIRMDVERLSLLRWLLWKGGSIPWKFQLKPRVQGENGS
jgi:hypothetical protein